jgi:protein gp37
MSVSKIEWTDRSDWNPIRGCTRVSPGCGGPGPHGGCYAEAIAARFSDPGQPFHGFAERTSKGPRWTGKVELVESRLALPLRWRKPARVFASSTSDIFHESLPDEAIDRIFAVMALAPHLTFQVLTKRSARMRDYLTSVQDRKSGNGHACHIYALGARMLAENDPKRREVPPRFPLPNVWLGVSVEDQTRANERREDFHATPAAVKFVSYEPALGPVDWDGWEFVDQIIGGGESGPNARPCHPDWQRAARDFCAGSGIAYLFKQWGEWAPNVVRTMLDGDRAGDLVGSTIISSTDRKKAGARVFYAMPAGAKSEPCMVERMERVGKKRAGRLLDGVQHDGYPA